MDRLTKFYIHKSEVLAERLNALENELNYLREDAPASVFKGTGAGQQAFSDSELEDQMRSFKKGGLLQKVEDENQTQEYKDAKAELDRRRAPTTNPDSSDSWIDRLNVPASEKGDLKAMRLGVIDKFNKGEEPLDSDAATITATGKRIQKEVENTPSVPDAITNAMMGTSSKPKAEEKPKSEVVQGEDDFVAKERHKGVQGIVKKAFDDVGIGAAGINVEGPAAPRETKATSSDVQQFANRLLNPLANIPMAKGARSAKPVKPQTEFAANAAEAGGEYKTDRSGYLQSVYSPDSDTTSSDVQQFANRLLNPLANIPMAKGARSAKPKMGSTGVPGALPVPEQERGQWNLSQEDWKTLHGEDTPYPFGEKESPEPAPAPDPEPASDPLSRQEREKIEFGPEVATGDIQRLRGNYGVPKPQKLSQLYGTDSVAGMDTEGPPTPLYDVSKAPAPEPAPRVKSKGIKVGKTVNDAVANLINAAAPKVSDFMKKNLAKTTPNAMREKLSGTTDVPGAVPAPKQERGQFNLSQEDWDTLYGYETGNPFITANAFGGEPTVSSKPDALPGIKPEANAMKAAKDYMDKILLRNYRR